MSKFFPRGRYDDEPDTVPSRLDALTLHSRLEQREQYRDGWRRNLSIIALVLIGALVLTFLLR
ncbi:hypothetical protein [Variovorax sp. ZT4R33]|uniref:hypothetical protein n=1 Tax=Variovorax sp. ZT4R33 TaxID=3443743 RepID=UPI003F456DA1